MLKVLLVLGIVSLVLSIIMNALVKQGKTTGLYTLVSIIQAACAGAMVGLLIFLVLKGRTIV